MKNLIKKTIPITATFFKSLRLTSSLALVEKYLCFLQGKGYGTGWDLDSEPLAAARCISGEKPFVVDLGANKGEWSLRLSQILKRDAHFLLVEPQQRCLGLLENLPISKKVVACVVSQKDGEIDFYEYDNSKLSSLHKREDTLGAFKLPKIHKIPARSLDSLLQELGIETVDFVKMDLEGHELFAMKGAEQAIRAGKIRALSFEFGISNLNSRLFFKDIFDFLSGFSFTLDRILPGGRLHRISGYSEDLERFSGVANYIVRFKL